MVLPPLTEYQHSSRPLEHNRRPSQGEKVTQVHCSRCNGSGHTRLNCLNPLPKAIDSFLYGVRQVREERLHRVAYVEKQNV